jgi:hypothetical protein
MEKVDLTDEILAICRIYEWLGKVLSSEMMPKDKPSSDAILNAAVLLWNRRNAFSDTKWIDYREDQD